MSDIEREEFEQAVADKWSDSYKFTRFGDEDYYDEVLEGMWRGWQASRQALEGEPVAWWDGDTSAAEDSFSFKLNRCYTIPLYTHPASAEVERLQSRVAEKCDAPVGWIGPEKYKAACESKMKFFKTIKELREQNEKLQAQVVELVAVAVSVRDDLLLRSEIDSDGTRCVNLSASKWSSFCDVIDDNESMEDDQ